MIKGASEFALPTARLITVLSRDRLELPGLLFQTSPATKSLAIYLHGMGDNGVFYRPARINTMAASLNRRGIALLAFNNRGAHGQKNLKIADDSLPEEDRIYQGGTYNELISESVYDIDGAVDFAKHLGYTELFMIGLSTGANKICLYSWVTKKTPFAKYVLAGPDDDTGLFYVSLGEKKYWSALDVARKAVAAGNGYKAMPGYSGMNPFSANSAIDILDPDGDYNIFPYYEATFGRLGKKKMFREYCSIDKPTLVIIGEEDEYMTHAGGAKQALNTLMEHTPNQMMKTTDFALLANADHSFTSQETEFAEYVSDWLTNG